jgi:hypothetical protein
MNFINRLAKFFGVKSDDGRYVNHPEAVIVACYFNPQKNPYRLENFTKFHDSIKHLNHQIVECVIGDDQPELPKSPNITTVKATSLLWHKESLLNYAIAKLDRKYKYVFWLDADIIFTNKNWLVESVESLQINNIVQPFEYCVHLEKDMDTVDFDMTHEYKKVSDPKYRHPRMWRSFCANCATTDLGDNENYDVHGHVGFAWGARREVLDAIPLYDKALVGGADHIMAHAAAGHIPHTCITKSFTEDIDAVNQWSREFYSVVRGKIGYAKGDLFHMWHGDLKNREYLKRIREFTPIAKTIYKKDNNGLYVTENDKYVREYFDRRERTDDGFLNSMIMGYMTNDPLMGGIIGGNMIGGMIGAEMNHSEDDPSHSHEHNNENNNHNNDNTYEQNENFS